MKTTMSGSVAPHFASAAHTVSNARKIQTAKRRRSRRLRSTMATLILKPKKEETVIRSKSLCTSKRKSALVALFVAGLSSVAVVETL